MITDLKDMSADATQCLRERYRVLLRNKHKQKMLSKRREDILYYVVEACLLEDLSREF